MPRDRDLKRIIRKRMEKTGETYTTARAHLIDNDEPAPPEPPAPPPAGAAPPAQDHASIAGMSDDAVRARTGRDWAAWLTTLDAAGAATLEHGAIARIVQEEYGVGDWWAQMVTVGYERLRGLRERGQRRSGEWEASRSRTFAVPVETLFDAWADDAQRRRWLTGADPVVRTASKPKSIRLGWDDGSIVALWFTAKGAAKSAVSVQHTRLPDRAAVDAAKQYWGEQLDALAVRLAGKAPARPARH